MAAPQDRLGQQMGEYRLLRLLGKGAFGAVYLAEHIHDGSQAAIKLLQVRLTHPEDFKAFLNEARTIRLRHSHIVPLLDFGLNGENQPFLVMEYAAGGTLRDRHSKGSRLPLPTLVSYVQQVASALQYAHERRVIHRDVKPENMLMRADGSLLLSDFGIATVAHSSHSINLQQGIGGTLPYMAPEQIQGKPRPASDQYALAVVVYEWIAGQRPFQGTAVEIAMQHAMTAPPSLLELVPTLSKDVELVVFKALTKDPKERFASIELFAQALQATIQSPPASVSQNVPILVFQSSTTLLPLTGMPVEAASTPEQDQQHSSIPDTLLPQSGPARPTSELMEAKSGTVRPNNLVSGAQPDTTAMPFPARLEIAVVPTSTNTFAPTLIHTLSQYKQIIRDTLALLSIPLFVMFELYLLFIFPLNNLSGLSFSLIFFLMPYIAGILAAAISGRRGFDAIFPVLIGCILAAGYCAFLIFFLQL